MYFTKTFTPLFQRSSILSPGSHWNGCSSSSRMCFWLGQAVKSLSGISCPGPGWEINPDTVQLCQEKEFLCWCGWFNSLTEQQPWEHLPPTWYLAGTTLIVVLCKTIIAAAFAGVNLAEQNMNVQGRQDGNKAVHKQQQLPLPLCSVH